MVPRESSNYFKTQLAASQLLQALQAQTSSRAERRDPGNIMLDCFVAMLRAMTAFTGFFNTTLVALPRGSARALKI